MKKKVKVPTKKLKKGFEMPVFGLGTWRVGGTFIRNPFNNDKADIGSIRNAIDADITHIDTAEIYAGGHAEKLVGQAIKGYNRKKLFIVSKVSPLHFRYKDLIRSCENSLRRLETDYSDLYLLHAPNPYVAISETMGAMDKLVERGLVRHIGVSNFTKERMANAQKVAKNKIVANQVHYNLIFREPEATSLLKYCQENDVMLCAWRPVEKGKLADRGIKIIDAMCLKYKKTPAQIAINWLTSQKNVVTLAKMGSREHLLENLGAIGWKIEMKDIEKLRREFPNQEKISDIIPLS